MQKLTLNLDEKEVKDLLTNYVEDNITLGYQVKSIIFKMTDEGFERNIGYGHKFTGADVILEKLEKPDTVQVHK